MAIDQGDHSKALWAQLLYINEWANDAELRAQAEPDEQSEWLARVRAAYTNPVPTSALPAPEYEPG